MFLNIDESIFTRYFNNINFFKQYTTMKKITLAATIVFSTLTTFAQGWAMDKAHSRLRFNVTHLLVSDVEGKFKSFDVSVTSSKDDFTDAVIELSADISSINTDNDYRDNDLKSPNFFDAAKFPTLSFKSTSFIKVDVKNYKLKGNLTIHGVTKPVELAVIFNGTSQNPANKKTVAGFRIKGNIKRKDFGVGSGTSTMVVSDEVEIDANVELDKG
jgi:polyisoprenoid-binding protein YceI